MNFLIKIGCLVSVLVMACSSASYAADEWVADEILQQLSDLRREVNSLKGQVAELKKDVAAVRQANNAAGPSVSLDDDPVLGDEGAKVAIVEFTDYQCPFCRRFHKETLPKIKEQYINTGKIKFVRRDFPLGFHGEAKAAAIAANCAGKQKAYWQMSDALFASQRSLGAPLYLELAQKLNLDKQKFESCLNDPGQIQEVEHDLDEGQVAGVSGTPAFLIGKLKDGKLTNAQLVSGARPFSSFAKVIDSMLE